MKSFLAMLMVLIVSGDDEVTIIGIVEDRVLLPCPCQNRNLFDEFRWQMEQPIRAKVLSHNNKTSVSDEYKDRAYTFQNEDIYNCSLLLTNITADDQGKYRCSFRHKGVYKASFVHLNVSAHYNLCQRSVTNLNDRLNVKEFQCDVNGRYRDTEILWYLDEQLLINSTTTKITHTYTLKAPTRYNFNSTLNTELSGTSEPICDVKAKGISAIIRNNCEPITDKRVFPEPPHFERYFKVIPIVLVIGFSLILLFRWKLSQGLATMRKVETNSSWC